MFSSLMIDPREDLVGDHVLWARLLSANPGETGALLHAARCEGAILTVGETRLQVNRGGIEPDVWRQTYLPWLKERQSAIERALTDAQSLGQSHSRGTT